MKKFVAMLICLAMLISFAVPAFAENENNLPVIYLEGKGNEAIYKQDGTLASNPSTIDRGQYIKNSVGPVLEELGRALLTGDYSDYIDALVASTAPIYEDIALNKDGEAEDTYIKWDCKTVPIDKNDKIFYFKYDWRLSPIDTAQQLDTYIERVLEQTGAKGVNIHCRCLGVNFAMAYVAKSLNGEYDHPFRVKNMMLNTSGLAGYITLGALLSGSVKIDADATDRFVTDYLSSGDMIDDPTLAMLAYSFVSILNYANILDLGVDFIQKIVDEIIDELLPKLALCCYGGYPSYWSMVSDEYYDKAINAVFSTDEMKKEYKNFIAKTDAYHELLGQTNEKTGLAKYEELLLKLKEQGVGIAVVAKYGSPSVPMFENSEVTGDVRGTVTELSFGAVGTEIGKTFSEKYLAQANDKGTDKYISPDETVDASSCLFPDTTWFIKNIKHDTFPDYFNELFEEFCQSGGEMSVFDEAEYPQYLVYCDGKVSADETSPGKDKWTNDPIRLLFRIVTGIIDWITKLLNKK